MGWIRLTLDGPGHPVNPPTEPDTSPLAPVTAIDPASVKSAGGRIRSVPRLDDGNPATVEEAGWQPLIATPNHPEYPAAHGTIGSSIA